MDAHKKLIPLHLHPLGFIEAFAGLGAGLEPLVAGTGISKRMLDREDVRISYHQQGLLVRNGIGVCEKPGLGLQVGQRFGWCFYGAVGGIVDCSPSLRDAGEAFSRYLMIAQPYYATSGRRPETYVDANRKLVYPLRAFPVAEHNAALALFELEFRLAIILRLWDACGNKSVPDPSVHVSLNYAEPPHANLYRELPCASVRFGCERSHIAAHAAFVIEPFRPHRQLAFNRLMARCEADLNDANLETTYTAKVRWHVHSQFNKQVTLEQVAEILNVRPRMLTRRLAAEGTTFREILHDVRMELTSYQLRSSHLSVEEVSDLMGFSSASSLRRAIRNWGGDSASARRS